MIPGPNGALACAATPGRPPTVIFLGGFMSDMTGAKATFLEAWCSARGQGFVRFDYTGHGASAGRFEDGTIGGWTADALAVIDQATSGPLILVGSSMGGWIATLCALARPDRVAALVGIAAAPDFTETLMWDAFDDATRAAILRDGQAPIPTAYGERPYIVTRALIEDGRRHLLLQVPIPLSIPVRLIHGQADPDVPWRTSLRLAEQLECPDVRVILVKDGDHRLSRAPDVALLGDILAPLLLQDGSQSLDEAGI